MREEVQTAYDDQPAQQTQPEKVNYFHSKQSEEELTARSRALKTKEFKDHLREVIQNQIKARKHPDISASPGLPRSSDLVF